MKKGNNQKNNKEKKNRKKSKSNNKTKDIEIIMKMRKRNTYFLY